MTSLFTAATPSQTLTSVHKDTAYISQTLLSKIQALCESVLSPHAYARVHRLLPSLAFVLYYACTTGANLNTCGQEFCQLVPSSTRRRSHLGKIPGWQRCVFVVAVGLSISEKEIFQHLKWARHWKPLVQCVSTLHHALFYFNKRYYWASHRLASIQLLSVTPSTDKQSAVSSQYPFSILGCLLLLKSASLLASAARATSSSDDPPPMQPQWNTTPAAETSEDCALCLNPRSNSTLCPCGHIFCWYCIGEWILDKPECPLCRRACTARDLLCVKY